jgi:nicotinamide N-methyltransferase
VYTRKFLLSQSAYARLWRGWRKNMRIAEVESLIECALASMAVDTEEPDYGDMSSCPGFGMSAARSTSGRSRRSSDVVKDGSVNSGSRLRRLETDTTLVEQYENSDGTLVHGKK